MCLAFLAFVEIHGISRFTLVGFYTLCILYACMTYIIYVYEYTHLIQRSARRTTNTLTHFHLPNFRGVPSQQHLTGCDYCGCITSLHFTNWESPVCQHGMPNRPRELTAFPPSKAAEIWQPKKYWSKARQNEWLFLLSFWDLMVFRVFRVCICDVLSTSLRAFDRVCDTLMTFALGSCARVES